MKKYLPIALGLAAFATAGAAPALARTTHHPATQDSRQMYLYARSSAPPSAAPRGAVSSQVATVNGQVVGQDPDANVQLSLMREFFANM
jgi:hypothetical protein